MASCGPSVDRLRACPAERATDLALSDDALREIALRAAAQPDQDVALPAVKLLMLLERLAVADAIANGLRAKIKSEQSAMSLFIRQRDEALARRDRWGGMSRTIADDCLRIIETEQRRLGGDPKRRLSATGRREAWRAMNVMREKLEEIARDA